VPDLTDRPDRPDTQPLDAAERYRYESELRRLRTEVELRDRSLQQLSGRLRDAEREAASAGGPVVEAMAAELRSSQQRAGQAEAELAGIRASVLYKAAVPVLTLYRLRRRLPDLSRRLARRLG